MASINANTDVDIPSAAPSESVAIATNPGARRSDRLVCGTAATVARRNAIALRCAGVARSNFPTGNLRRCIGTPIQCILATGVIKREALTASTAPAILYS